MGQIKPSLLITLAVMLMTALLAQERTFYILHTNNTNGALENCYCPDHPFGAVEKRSIYVSNFLKKHPNTILLDAGDIFTMTHQSLKDSLMAEAYNQLPYDVILFGDQELTMSDTKLNQLVGQMDIPVVGTNIDHPETVKSHIIEKEDMRIAILGIIDPYAVKYYPKDVREKIEISDPIESIQAEMEGLKDKADIFILLTHQGADLDYVIAEKINGLHTIIGGHSQSAIETPETVNGALIAQAGKEGYYIGVVELIIKDGNVIEQSGRIDTMKLEMPDDQRIMQMIEEYEQRSGRINHQKSKLKEKH